MLMYIIIETIPKIAHVSIQQLASSPIKDMNSPWSLLGRTSLSPSSQVSNAYSPPCLGSPNCSCRNPDGSVSMFQKSIWGVQFSPDFFSCIYSSFLLWFSEWSIVMPSVLTRRLEIVIPSQLRTQTHTPLTCLGKLEEGRGEVILIIFHVIVTYDH